jgi:small subunit ribosomal protein S20
MANNRQAKKRIRQIAKRTAVNRDRRSNMRGCIRNVEEAIASGDKTAASGALSVAEPALARAAQKGILHRNTAARKISRLNNRVNAMAG